MRVNILKGTYLEFKKMKKKKVLIIALLFTLVTIVWTMAVSNNFYSRGETSPSDMWLYGLTSIAQINALLSPIFLSITASKVSEIEHRGATLKILLTRQSRANLYASKFVYCEIVATLCTLVQFLGFIAATYFSDFFEAVPVSLMIQSVFAVVVVNTMLIAIFLLVCISIKNQVYGVGSGLLLGLLGIISMLFPRNIAMFIPSYYYMDLIPARMIMGMKRITGFEILPFDLGTIGIVMVFSLFLIVVGLMFFNRKEV